MNKIIVTTSKGLDELLKSEIESLCDCDEIKVQPGQITLSVSTDDMYKVCLHSRLANRVLLILAEGKCNSAEELYDVASSVNWPSHFAQTSGFVINFNGTNRAINNSQFGALKIKDAIVDSFQESGLARPNVDKTNPDIRIQGRLRRDNLSISIDLSGGSLHMRGYRADAGEAPLKEHVAAAMLMRSGWVASSDKPMLDPMCGSGTIAIEAAMIAANIAPSINRQQWGFTHWLLHDESVFQQQKRQANEQRKTPASPIFAFDLSSKLLSIAKANAALAGVEEFITFKQGNVTELTTPTPQPGYIICNPPYGERLGEYSELLPLFVGMGERLKSGFSGWQMSLLSNSADLLKAMKLSSHKTYKVMNGPLECSIFNYTLSDKNLETYEIDLKDSEFANRLRKNLRRMQSWIKSSKTNAYRIYDADLPHYNVAIDRYADWVVVQEYAPPKDIPVEKAKHRLQEVLMHLPTVLNIDANKIATKVRSQQKGKEQYKRIEQQNNRVIIDEFDAKFYINPTDYLDTGLFLDHRITRQLFKLSAQGKHVLNLFAYTGSVSVHAAMGGAKSVTTVDMSNTYLEWAKDNFQLNQLQGAFDFVQSDCLTWLSRQSAKFDLMFIDPPSFSNSKRMENTWDVQRDYLSLLADARESLQPNGQIYFSNNLRQFKLDEDAVTALGFTVENISAKTIPEDFKRNQKIHHCWILTSCS